MEWLARSDRRRGPRWLSLVVAVVTACAQGDAVSAPETEIVGIAVQPRTVVLDETQSQQFQAQGVTESGALVPATVRWAASGGTIDADGLFAAVGAEGEHRIVATHTVRTWLSDTASVSINALAVDTSLVLTPASVSVAVGDSVDFRAVAVLSSGDTSDANVTWATEGDATVEAIGPGRGRFRAGSTTGLRRVFVQDTDGGADTSVVDVSAATVDRVDLSPTSADLFVGEQVQFTATPRDEQGTALPGRVVTWVSSAPSIATVTGSGVVTGRSTGSATITATSEGRSAAAAVDVTPSAVASVEITPSSLNLSVGQNGQLSATVRDASGNPLTGRIVTWSSSNSSVASVGQDGSVNALTAGAASITATSEGRSDTASVSVSGGAVASVDVTPANATLLSGSSLQLTATPRDAAGNPLNGRPIAWQSNNTAVATVNGNGLVQALSTGQATIAASSEGASGTARVTVTANVPPNLQEPVYDPANPDHVLHFFDDFANYSTPEDMERVGTNPNRVGGTWQLRGFFAGGLDAPDPFTGGQSVRISYPDPGSARRNDGGVSIGPSDYVNERGDEDVIIIEYAYRELGPNPFQGKIVDFNAGWNNGSIGRFDFNNGVGWPMGGSSAPSCSVDPTCSRYYAGNNDNDLTPRFAGLPPESGRGVGDPVRYVQLRTEGVNMPTIDPNQSFLQGYRQNRNWGLGPGQFDWMNNRDMRGQGNPPSAMPWMVIKERFTKEAPGGRYGEGRIEHWIGQSPGALVKVIEYVGDPGAFDEGAVFVGPRNRSFFSANVNLMWPQGQQALPNTNVLFGYVRVWSHSRQ